VGLRLAKTVVSGIENGPAIWVGGPPFTCTMSVARACTDACLLIAEAFFAASACSSIVASSGPLSAEVIANPALMRDEDANRPGRAALGGGCLDADRLEAARKHDLSERGRRHLVELDRCTGVRPSGIRRPRNRSDPEGDQGGAEIRQESEA
jgi:hypothetical protein